MILKTILLLLPTIAYGNILVHILVANPEVESPIKQHVEYLGAGVDVVGVEDIKSFKLEEDTLREAVKTLTGALPTRSFVKSPAVIEATEDLYKNNHFAEVNRIIVPMTGDIINFKIDRVDLSTVKSKDGVREILEESIKVKWDKPIPITKDVDIVYDVAVMNSYTQTGQQKIHWAVHSHVGDPIVQKREREVIKKEKEEILTGLKVTMELQVNYTVGLSGDVISYFPEGLNGKKIWNHEINDVLIAAKMVNTHEIYENIELELYVNV